MRTTLSTVDEVALNPAESGKLASSTTYWKSQDFVGGNRMLALGKRFAIATAAVGWEAAKSGRYPDPFVRSSFLYSVPVSQPFLTHVSRSMSSLPSIVRRALSAFSVILGFR